MREFSYKLVTFFLNMTQAAPTSQAQLKRELEALSKDIFEIDLKIEQFRQQRKVQHIASLEAAKIELQKRIVQKKIQLELKNVQNRNRY